MFDIVNVAHNYVRLCAVPSAFPTDREAATTKAVATLRGMYM